MNQNEPVMSQRARFEAWATRHEMDISYFVPTNGRPSFYTDQRTGRAWLAWQAACPEGWQCVPKDQTRHMAYAVEETQLSEFCTSSRQSRHHDLGRQVYEANLAAAPRPEDACKSPG